MTLTFEPPDKVDVGLTDVIVGDGLLTVKAWLFEEPLEALQTVTFSVPAVATSGAGTIAVSDDDETNVVARDVPFHCTVDAAINWEPFTVIVNWAAPVVAALGEIEEMVAQITQLTETGETCPRGRR